MIHLKTTYKHKYYSKTVTGPVRMYGLRNNVTVYLKSIFQ